MHCLPVRVAQKLAFPAASVSEPAKEIRWLSTFLKRDQERECVRIENGLERAKEVWSEGKKTMGCG